MMSPARRPRKPKRPNPKDTTTQPTEPLLTSDRQPSLTEGYDEAPPQPDDGTVKNEDTSGVPLWVCGNHANPRHTAKNKTERQALSNKFGCNKWSVQQ